MINEKFFKLVNKDIDGVISPREKKLLDETVKSDPEAAKIARGMKEANLALNKLPDVEPSENLKKNILNSIDFSRYPVKKTKKSFLPFTVPAPRKGLMVSFALGLAAGIIIFALFFQNPGIEDLTGDQLTSGTMGLSNGQIIKSIPINIQKINGNIVILRGRGENEEESSADHFEMKVYMKAQEQTDLEFNFDSADPDIENFMSSGNVSIAKESGKIKISSLGQQNSAVIFSFNGNLPEQLTVKVFSSGDELFWQKVSLRH